MALFVPLAVLVGALAQSVSGIGFVLICGPALVAVMGPQDGVALALALSAVTSITVLCRGWRSVQVKSALQLFVPSALMAPLWAHLFSGLSLQTAYRMIGVVVLAAVTMSASGVQLRWMRGSVGAVLAGAIASAMSAAAGVGGVAAALYATNAGWRPSQMRVTLQAYFLSMNVVLLSTLGLPQWNTTVMLPAAGAMLVGIGAGVIVGPKVKDPWPRRVTLLLAAASGVLLLLRS